MEIIVAALLVIVSLVFVAITIDAARGPKNVGNQASYGDGSQAQLNDRVKSSNSSSTA